MESLLLLIFVSRDVHLSTPINNVIVPLFQSFREKSSSDNVGDLLLVGCASEGFFRAEPLVELLLAVVEHSEAEDAMGSSLIVMADWRSWGLLWDDSSDSWLG